jgi:LPXTG-motif cell wall-anchored protein
MNITQEDTMKRQASLVTLFATTGALLIGSMAHAQGGPPAGFVPPSGPPAGFTPPSGGPGGTTDAGAISNTTTTTTVTDSEFATDTATLPDTGGAPLLMALAGSMAAGGAFFLRRKLA